MGKNLFANFGPRDCNSGHVASQRNRFHYAIDSTDVMYQVRRIPWRCIFYNLANLARDRAVFIFHTSRIKDNWTPKFLSVKQLITFDRAVMVYKIFNKLCPGNLWNKFNLRSHHSRYNTRFCRNIQIPKYNL